MFVWLHISDKCSILVSKSVKGLSRSYDGERHWLWKFQVNLTASAPITVWINYIVAKIFNTKDVLGNCFWWKVLSWELLIEAVHNDRADHMLNIERLLTYGCSKSTQRCTTCIVVTALLTGIKSMYRKPTAHFAKEKSTVCISFGTKKQLLNIGSSFQARAMCGSQEIISTTIL